MYTHPLIFLIRLLHISIKTQTRQTVTSAADDADQGSEGGGVITAMTPLTTKAKRTVFMFLHLCL